VSLSPNPHPFVHRNRSFHTRHSATKRYLLEICGSTIDLSPHTHSQGATHRTFHSNGRVRCSSRDSRNPTTAVILWSHASHRSRAFNAHMQWRFVARSPYPSMEYYGDSEAGRWDLGSLSGVSLSTCFSPSSFFVPGFGSVAMVHLFFDFRTCLFLTIITSAVSYTCRPLLSCATSLIYHPLCRSVYICRSITRIRLFINYGTSSLFSIHVSNPVFRCRAAPLPQNPDEVDLCRH
jgi:hypothetical protein